jgi:hypothetical protein
VTRATIDIALAAWNGERYLPAMLDSIAAQTYGDWRLVVRDDGSTDNTVAIIETFARRFPNKVVLVKDGEGRLRATGNFAAAARACDASYVAFADQDDVWLPHKLELAMARMVDAERQCGVDAPVLVHTDLRVVDEELNEIAPSFVRHMKLDPVAGAKLERLLVRNIATGCTMLCNRALIDVALPLPSGALLHDTWFALVAACFGSILFVEVPTVLYRQHADNAVGAGGVWSVRRWGSVGVRERVKRRYAQARAMSDHFDGRLPAWSRAVLDDFAELEYQGPWKRALRMFAKGYRDHGLIRTAAAALLG